MIQYRLDDLGWYQFEWLCQALLKATYGASLEAWGGHSDLGRDAYCSQPLQLEGQDEPTPGPFVFQVKFVEGANAAGAKPGPSLQSAVLAESKQIKTRMSHTTVSRPRHYVLLTNSPLTPKLRKHITDTLASVLPGTQIALNGSTDICSMLANAPNIRTTFPQLLGLTDLTELVSAAVEKPIIERSTLSIERAQELALVFAPTRAFNEALEKLARDSFVVLTGPPEMGKTCIARIIGLCKYSEGWEAYECRNPADFLQVYKRDVRQVFVADDAFGSTEYRPDIAQAWGDELDGILRRIDKKHWFLWTSRPAPLNLALARIRLQGRAERFPAPGAVLVDAGALKIKEKALILYRHAKAAGLEKVARNLVKTHIRLILENPHFTPERIRRFVADYLPRIVARVSNNNIASAEISAAVAQEIETPTGAMRQSFQLLPKEHQLFLISMLDVESATPNVRAVHEAFIRHTSGASIRDVDRVAEDLDGHFVRKVESTGVRSALRRSQLKQQIYDWVHPSWRDLIIEYLGSNADARSAFLARCTSPGVLLALSTGGGGEGKRAFPLAQDQQDWGRICEAIQRTLNSADQHSTAGILIALADGFAPETLKGAQRPPATDDVLEITQTALDTCHAKWSVARVVLDTDVLRSYYRLSAAHAPLVGSPELSETWKVCWSAAAEEFGKNQVDLDIETEAVERWAGLVKLLSRNEPRFLRFHGFPNHFIPLVKRFLRRVENYIDDDADLGTEDDYQNEIAHLYHLGELVDLLGEAVPDIEPAAADVEKSLSLRQSILENERYETFPDADQDYEPEERHPVGHFDVDEFFADL